MIELGIGLVQAWPLDTLGCVTYRFMKASVSSRIMRLQIEELTSRWRCKSGRIKALTSSQPEGQTRGQMCDQSRWTFSRVCKNKRCPTALPKEMGNAVFSGEVGSLKFCKEGAMPGKSWILEKSSLCYFWASSIEGWKVRYGISFFFQRFSMESTL